MTTAALVRWKLRREFPPPLEEPLETIHDWRSGGEPKKKQGGK